MNPSIGYGLRTMTYADGRTREFYQIGLSANSTGISVYIMGLDDRAYLAKTYGPSLGIVLAICWASGAIFVASMAINNDWI